MSAKNILNLLKTLRYRLVGYLQSNFGKFQKTNFKYQTNNNKQIRNNKQEQLRNDRISAWKIGIWSLFAGGTRKGNICCLGFVICPDKVKCNV